MALFGDEDGDVGSFVMAEGGEEWFPFTLDNLEMDRACSSLPEDSRPMDQVCLPLALPQKNVFAKEKNSRHAEVPVELHYAHPERCTTEANGHTPAPLACCQGTESPVLCSLHETL